MSYGKGKGKGKPGDWTCPQCSDHVFASNQACRRCGAAKPSGAGIGSAPGGDLSAAPVPAGGKPGDWTCPQCNDHVFASNAACRRCSTPKPSGAGTAAACGRPGDWTCPGCGGTVFGSKDTCWKCGTCKPVVWSGPGGALQTAPVSTGGKPGDWCCPGCGGVVFGSKDACWKCGTGKPKLPVAAGGASAGPSAAGDWSCPTCSDLVFASRAACRKCGTQRPNATSVMPECASSLAAGGPRPGDWRCPKCSDVQFASRDECRQCGEPRPQWLGSTLSMAPPTYWQVQAVDGPAWSLVTASSSELAALRIGMVPGGSFGGKDQKTPLGYKNLAPYAAWRLQHLGLWGKYGMERENLRVMQAKSLAKNGISIPRVDIRPAYVQMAEKLPADLDRDVNEVYLSHGSKPECVLAILSGGLNERFSGGLFGNGTYLAEDVAKNDQYCTPDLRHGAHPDLHKMLFDELGVAHPGQLYYVFFCRALLGSRVRTRDGSTDLDLPGRSIWSSEKRELASIMGSSPPVLHHSLLAETGGKLMRFREFVIYHGDQVYPEYLVAYQRK